MRYPTFVAAAVQAAPVYFDADATVEHARALITEAAANGAKLVAFPEVFVPGYPYWNWTMTPVEGSPWFEKLFLSAIDIPGPEVGALQAAARDNECTVVIGVNERDPFSMGTLYNTILTINHQGELIGIHRKLVPTWAEKLTWGNGDGSSLKVHDTPVGRLGVLACGENTNTLARYALLAQGENVHVASYISLPTAPADYDMVEAIRLRGAAHSFEGKVFTIISCSAITPDVIDAVGHDEHTRSLLSRKNAAFSGIFGPDGRQISESLIDKEGIVYAEIDLNRCIQQKQMHDIIGHYNRFDVFQLHVNRTPQQSLWSTESSSGAPDDIPAATVPHSPELNGTY